LPAINADAKYVALLNNDAVANKNWLVHLQDFLDNNAEAGIATSKILEAKSNKLDSTGECYTVWALSYPRGRGEADTDRYDKNTWIFGASGGASMYRVELLKQIGLFDEDFFAYYEDVDISFRAQLAGWKVAYVPNAVVHHQIGATSSKVKGLTTYHTLKNLPLLLWKNVPWTLVPKIWIRLAFAYSTFAGKAITRGQFGPLFKALLVGSLLWPKKLIERNKIQRTRKVTAKYIDSIITHDLPPSAKNLRLLRSKWWKIARYNK
jgi:GT2 family glycosyltransferase